MFSTPKLYLIFMILKVYNLWQIIVLSSPHQSVLKLYLFTIILHHFKANVHLRSNHIIRWCGVWSGTKWFQQKEAINCALWMLSPVHLPMCLQQMNEDGISFLSYNYHVPSSVQPPNCWNVMKQGSYYEGGGDENMRQVCMFHNVNHLYEWKRLM